jgi:hypothetical protein
MADTSSNPMLEQSETKDHPVSLSEDEAQELRARKWQLLTGEAHLIAFLARVMAKEFRASEEKNEI